MPIGISFYTFQSMSYTVDVYRKEVSVQKNIYKLALYITFFPQLIAGPIVKYHDIEYQIDNRKEDLDQVYYGIKRFILGLSKKVLLANTLGAIADKVFSLPVHNFDCLTAWIGALAYSFQLFYDFSGYSDMAIGLGSIFGFKFLENFNYPYISKSITEFWRRWHISLSTWFKEYLYIPLGGNRVSKKRNLLNLWIVFLATGIWHGAEWTFVVWGMWHGLFIIIERLTNFAKKEGGKGLSLFKHAYTILAFVIGWVIFRAENLPYAYQYIQNMFGIIKEHHISYELSYYINNKEILAFFFSTLLSFPLFKNILNLKTNNVFILYSTDVLIFFLFLLSCSSLLASTYNPFIYFRF
ncbi:MAG: MBOAT family protein [Alphaproteobacteria bacterium]|nr:MBOAT family protein [Alphaproteobacteria bacterium]